MACQTQWRVGMNGATGLDYGGVQAVMQMRGIEDTNDCLDRIQVMEFEQLTIQADKQDS